MRPLLTTTSPDITDCTEGGLSPQPYIVQQFISLEGVKLQVTWIPIQHQAFGAWVHHQVCPDTFSCKGT